MKRFWADLSDVFVEQERTYIVCNDQAQFFSGLRGGKPEFSESYDDAKPLERESQFRTLVRISDVPIFKEYIEN
ncbi:hypothetical protein OAA39_00660 [bacterium]|mgnify:FL=1|nr:hypothetical protein [bacterium]